MKKLNKFLLGLTGTICAGGTLAPILVATSCNCAIVINSSDFALIRTSKGYCVHGLAREDVSSVKSIVVPEKINGVPVVEISKGAFKGCSNLESITLPFIGHTADSSGANGLFGYIFGDEMYEGCTVYTWQSYSINDAYDVLPTEGYQFALPATLRNVTITGNTKIAPGAFSGCMTLKSIEFKNSSSNALTTTEISNFAFYNCKALKNFTIPSSITTIGRCAFQGCRKLKQLTISNKIETIKHQAFSNCVSLYKVELSDTVKNMGKLVFENFGGLILCSTKTVPEGWDSEWVSKTAAVVYDYAGGGIVYTNDMIAAICGKEEKYASVIQLLGNYWKSEEITIPSTVEYGGQTYTIKHLGANLFYDNTDVKKVTISEGVEILGTNCFDNCTNLETINFPESLKTIRANCFAGCNKLQYHTGDIGEGVIGNVPGIDFKHVQEIGDSAFAQLEGIQYVDFGDSLTTIGDSAFEYCVNLIPLREKGSSTNLHPLKFPKTIKSIGDYAFSNICKYMPKEGGTMLKSQAGDIIFEAGNENEVTIGSSAFESAGVRSTGVYETQMYFYIDFNNINIKKFNYRTFRSCYLYGVYNFPQSLTEIGEQAFYDSVINYTMTNTADWSSRLLSIPKTVTNIGRYAFYSCSGCAFRFDGARDGSSQLKTIGEFAFRYCSYNPAVSAKDQTGTDHSWSEADQAWASRWVYVPNTVTTIGQYAFSYMSGVKYVHLSENPEYTRLEHYTFNGCANLGSDVGETVDTQSAEDPNVKYRTYKNPIIVPENITYFGTGVFSSCTLLTAITIKGKLTTLGGSAFSSCTTLNHGKNYGDATNKIIMQSLIFEQGLQTVTSFGGSIYSGCTNLVWAPWQMAGGGTTTGFASIPASSFANCENLSDFNILPAVTSIGANAFSRCRAMTAVTGMSAVKYIYQNAFVDCTSLTTFEMPDGCHTIGDGAFQNCTELGKDKQFKLPKDIVKEWDSSVNIGMGLNPFVGWTSSQYICFRSENINDEETAKKTDGTIILKWGWELQEAGVEGTTKIYTCTKSGSKDVKFFLEGTM